MSEETATDILIRRGDGDGGSGGGRSGRRDDDFDERRLKKSGDFSLSRSINHDFLVEFNWVFGRRQIIVRLIEEDDFGSARFGRHWIEIETVLMTHFNVYVIVG